MSLARPGGNTTGMSVLAIELDGKRQEILIEAVPGLRRMAEIADPNTTTPQQLQALKDGRGLAVSAFDSSGHRQPRKFQRLSRNEGFGRRALNVLPSPPNGNRQIIFQRATEMRLTAIYQSPEEAEEGGFMAYGPGLSDVSRLIAPQIVKLLRGTKPADIPVEQPTKFERDQPQDRDNAWAHNPESFLDAPTR